VHPCRISPATPGATRPHALALALPRPGVHGAASPRAGGGLEGAAAPSMRFAGVPLPSPRAGSAGPGGPSSPRFADARARGTLPPVSPRAAAAAAAPPPVSPRGGGGGAQPATPLGAAANAALASAGSQHMAALAASMSLHSPRVRCAACSCCMHEVHLW
jgi:hypothetical protein